MLTKFANLVHWHDKCWLRLVGSLPTAKASQAVPCLFLSSCTSILKNYGVKLLFLLWILFVLSSSRFKKATSLFNSWSMHFRRAKPLSVIESSSQGYMYRDFPAFYQVSQQSLVTFRVVSGVTLLISLILLISLFFFFQRAVAFRIRWRLVIFQYFQRS